MTLNTVKSIPTEAYFPDCVLPSCERLKSGEIHQHILPQQKRVIDTSAKYYYTQGGVGSGKTTAIAAACVKLSVEIPRNRGVVSRYNFDDLFDSSWKAVVSCIETLAERGHIPNPTFRKMTQGEYTEIELHNRSIIKAVQGKNWRRGLGADHGWFWVDDAMECLEEFFIGTETSAGLLSRLRLPHVHFDQNTYDVQHREHGSLHGYVSSNPPPVNHWLHTLFGKTEGIHTIGEDIVEWARGETTDNPFTGVSYAKGLIAAQRQMGRDDNVVRRVIFGESIPAYGGVGVFSKQFSHARHVGSYKYDKDIPLVAGWDFGFLHPAVLFSNLYKCEYGTNHHTTLSEVVDGFSLTVYDMWLNFVKPHIDALYKDACLILHAGDKAGYRASSSNRDRRGDMKILKDEFKLPFIFRVLDLNHSLQYCRHLLEPKKPCPCGMELIRIDASCKVLIGGLEGGYKYLKSRDGRISEKPSEDRYFADAACAWRYSVENFVKWGLPWEYRKELPQPVRTATVRSEPWAWMEMTDKEMAEMLVR